MVFLIAVSLIFPFLIAITTANGLKTNGQPYFGILNDVFSDEGELVELKYLTNDGGGYHIIQFTIPSVGVPTSIHLVKTDSVSPDLRVNDDGDEMDMDFQNCFYYGHVLETPGGTSALSDCGDSPGFSGHILIGEDHFVIEPVSENANRSSETEKKGTSVLHKVFRAQNILERENASHSDVMRVPADELKKAIEEQEAAESEEEEEPPEDLLTMESFDSSETEYDLINAFAKSKSKNKKNKKGKKKMSVNGPKVVEIAVFTDEKLFKVWKKRYAKDTKAKLKLFLLNLVNNMNLLFKQESLGVDVTFRLVYLEMLQSVPSDLKSSDGEATKYLKSFCQYAGNKNSNGAEWDHALLLTGFDLKEGSETDIAGMAWFQTMCLKYWSCSVSEGTSFGSSFIVTHEMGHSLGMEHDGTGVSKGCSEDKFIMSPTTGAGKTTWSTCSVKNLKDFITKGTSDANREEPASIPTCITRASPLKSKRIPFAKNKLPGEVFGQKAQCQYDCGTDCTPSVLKSSTVCSMLWCQSGLTSREAHPALEGTSCGIGKYCRSGKCKKIPK